MVSPASDPDPSILEPLAHPEDQAQTAELGLSQMLGRHHAKVMNKLATMEASYNDRLDNHTAKLNTLQQLTVEVAQNVVEVAQDVLQSYRDLMLLSELVASSTLLVPPASIPALPRHAAARPHTIDDAASRQMNAAPPGNAVPRDQYFLPQLFPVLIFGLAFLLTPFFMLLTWKACS